MQNGVQHFHVVGLGLDCVGKEGVSFVGQELLDRDLFYGHDHLCRRQIFLLDGAGGDVVLGWVVK